MKGLIPVIEIGKKYLWKSSTIELLCSNCGANMGNEPGDFEIEVVVKGIATNDKAICVNCKTRWVGSLEGWYKVQAIDNGETGNVPYTQLHEIEEE